MGSSATHIALNFSRRLKMHDFRPCRIMSFALLTCLLVLRWLTTNQSTQMLLLLQKQRNFLLVNWVLLLGMMVFRTPKRWMMSMKKSMVSSERTL